MSTRKSKDRGARCRVVVLVAFAILECVHGFATMTREPVVQRPGMSSFRLTTDGRTDPYRGALGNEL